MEPHISVKNISFSYASEDGGEDIQVLKNVSLDIARGEFVAVLGHNGCGKSTLAKHLNALLTPDSGSVVSCGYDTSDEKSRLKIRQKVGMVFQNPDNQLVATIVEEDVAFGPENLGVEPSEIRQRVDSALRAVDMYDYRRHEPHKLSGGQKQRVAIAGVIAMRPECIVLDEPTAMLDPKGRREVMDTVRALNRERNMTVVYITHYMDEAALADRVVVMSDGGIIEQGTPRQVFSQVDMLKSVGLDVPQTTELIYSLNRLGAALPDDILSVSECADAICRYLEV